MRKTQRDVVGEVVRGLVDVLNERLHSSQSAGTQHHESTQQGPMTVQHTVNLCIRARLQFVVLADKSDSKPVTAWTAAD